MGKQKRKVDAVGSAYPPLGKLLTFEAKGLRRCLVLLLNGH